MVDFLCLNLYKSLHVQYMVLHFLDSHWCVFYLICLTTFTYFYCFLHDICMFLHVLPVPESMAAQLSSTVYQGNSYLTEPYFVVCFLLYQIFPYKYTFYHVSLIKPCNKAINNLNNGIDEVVILCLTPITAMHFMLLCYKNEILV